jgi:hypothetical protein
MSRDKRIKRDVKVATYRERGLSWRDIGRLMRLSHVQCWRRYQAMREAYAA